MEQPLKATRLYRKALGSMLGGVIGDARMRKFQNDRFSALRIRRPQQPTVAPFGEKAVHSKLVDKISDRRQLANRQGCEGARQSALVSGRQPG